MSDASELLIAALGRRHDLKSVRTDLINGGTRYRTVWVCTCGKRGTVPGPRLAGETAHRNHRWSQR